MTPRSFTILAVLTACMVAAAAYAVSIQTAPVSLPTGSTPVFPDLAPNLNTIAEVEVKTNTRTYTVKRSGDDWVIAEVANHPVLFEKVKTALVDLSQLKLVEPKTADAARYDRLEVEDVTAKDAKSRHVRVRGDNGAVLASGFIGKRNASMFGTDKGGTYIRRDGDPRSWLAEGIVRLGEGPADWVKKDLFDVKGDEIKSVTVTEPSGGTMRVHRASAKDKDFKLEKIPQGKRQRGQWETNQMPKALESLALEDLNAEGAVKFTPGPYVAEFLTFDGLIIRSEATVRGPKGKPEYWAKFSASAADSTGADVDKVKKRAAAINARVKGYAFKVRESAGKILTCKLVNMLEGAGINACA